ncbi:MAG: hypothetical protein RRC34_04800 [Lentisphaeria bacterium]|nr:hypothetical protein [Lentisphaeria bacterium]
MIALLDRLSAWCADHTNPIVIKETRQMVRNKFVIGILLTLLAALLFAACAFILDNGSNPHRYFRGLGRELFALEFAILVFASALIPLNTGARLIKEREGDVDLLYVSAITPGEIIRGKLFAAIAFWLLMVSAALPFLVFNFVLRGIDIPSVMMSLALLFAGVVIATQIALLGGVFPGGKIIKGILAAIGAVLAFQILGGFFIFRHVSRMGRSTVSGFEWAPFLFVCCLFIAAAGVLHTCAVAMITSSQANRAWPVRLWLTGVWLAFAIFGLIYEWTTAGSAHFFDAWTGGSVIILTFVFIVILGSPPTHSPRVRRGLAKNSLLRLLTFPFVSGLVNGIVWVGGLLAGTLLITLIFADISGFDEDDIMGVLCFFFYGAAYGLTALVIQRKLLRQWIPRHLVWLLSVLVGIFFTILPVIMSFLLLGPSFRDLIWEFGCLPAALDNHRGLLPHLMGAGAWMVIMLLINVRYICQGLLTFSPPATPPPPPLPTPETVDEPTASQPETEA